MTSPRDDIFSRLSRSLGRGALSTERRRELAEGLSRPPRNLAPAYVAEASQNVLELFAKMVPLSAATLTRVPEWSLVPKEVAAYARLHNLPSQAVVSEDDGLTRLPWSEAVMTARFGAALTTDSLGVSLAYAGIAETGTVVDVSARDHAMSLNLLPECHISIVPQSRIVAGYEEVWNKMRDDFGEGIMPRTTLWITGPSRTADVGQQMLFGAHGPVREHIIVVEGA